MNYVKQAYAISNEKKQAALTLYKEAVAELVNKDYVLQVDDAHTDLSATFGMKWLHTQRGGGAFWLDAKLYAEANVAFNYANLTLGINGKFVALAKELVADDARIGDSRLKAMAAQMDSILTHTTVAAWQGELA